MAFMMLLQVLDEGSLAIIQISSLLVLVVLSVVVTTYHRTNSIPVSIFFIFSLLFIILLLSNLIALEVIGSSNFLRASAIIGYLIVGFLIAARLDHYIIERALPTYGIGVALVLAYVLYDNDRLFDRLSGHLHPNLWGFIIATSLPLVIFSKMHLLFKIVISTFFFYLLAFEFQSRAALSWAIFSFVVFLPFQFVGRSSRAYVKQFRIFGTAIALVASALLAIANFDFVRDVFQFDSTTRGVASGLSGRTTIWAEAFRVFQDRPLFGYGFDSGRYFASNFFAVYVAGEIESLHNSYLTMFFDTGLVGGSFYLFIIVFALGGAFVSRNLMLISFLVVYLGLGITDSRPLNVGNPPGLLFVILLPYLSTLFLLRREREREPKWF